MSLLGQATAGSPPRPATRRRRAPAQPQQQPTVPQVHRTPVLAAFLVQRGTSCLALGLAQQRLQSRHCPSRPPRLLHPCRHISLCMPSTESPADGDLARPSHAAHSAAAAAQAPPRAQTSGAPRARSATAAAGASASASATAAPGASASGTAAATATATAAAATAGAVSAAPARRAAASARRPRTPGVCPRRAALRSAGERPGVSHPHLATRAAASARASPASGSASEASRGIQRGVHAGTCVLRRVRQRTEGLLSLGPISGWLQACFQLRGKGKRTGRARASGAPTAPKPGQAGLRGAARARRSPRKKRGGGRERSRSRDRGRRRQRSSSSSSRRSSSSSSSRSRTPPRRARALPRVAAGACSACLRARRALLLP